MLSFKLFALCVVVLCLMPEQSQVSATFWWTKCRVRNCPNYERPVYTSDGTNCLIFRNSCHVKNYSCRRTRENLPYLSLVTLKTCQTLCPKDCNADKGTKVCGEYAGTYTTFDNECALKKFACEHGQAIIKVSNSACPKQG
ncbi:U-Kazal-Dg21.2-like [Cochliomyia hominivorax]